MPLRFMAFDLLILPSKVQPRAEAGAFQPAVVEGRVGIETPFPIEFVKYYQCR
jgi:hypothetical protein